MVTFKQILVLPGKLNKREGGDENVTKKSEFWRNFSTKCA